MSETTPVTTDIAGVNRTETGEITTAPVTEASPPTTTPSETPTSEPKAEPKAEEKSLLNAQPKPKAEAPKEYADFKVPEGYDLDPEVKSEAGKLFKSMNLSQDQAQELVNFYTAKTKEAWEQPFKAYQETRKEWRATAEQDPDLRGKLGPGGEVLSTIGKALDGLNDAKLASAFREVMDDTGAGDHPAFIKAFYLMAQRLTEGSHVAGRPAGQARPGAAGRTPAQDLWPNLPSVNRG